MIEEQIEQTIKSLAEKHKVKVKRGIEGVAYNPKDDIVYYNTKELRRAYNFLRKFDRISLEDLISHYFGHELGHRNKHKAGVEGSEEKARVMENWLYTPGRMMCFLEDQTKFPLYRAAAVAYFIINEFYAETNNSLYKPAVAKAEQIANIHTVKKLHENMRHVLHALYLFSADEIYATIPIILSLPASSIKRFFPQEYSVIARIRTYLQANISTPQDCFNLDKIEKLAEIILYEL